MSTFSYKKALPFIERSTIFFVYTLLMPVMMETKSSLINKLFNFENTLQASQAACCHDAQTGGFIFFRGQNAVF